MKKLFIILAFVFVNFSLFSQVTQDTNTVDTTNNNIQQQQQQQQVVVNYTKQYNPIVPFNIAGVFIENISRMLVWPKYYDYFVVGVTNSKALYAIAKQFDGVKIHGRDVEVKLVNENSLPLVNVIYVTADKSNLISSFDLNYQGKSVLIISENPNDIAQADIVIRQTKTSEGDDTYSYDYNGFAILAKNIFMMPEFKAYSTVSQ